MTQASTALSQTSTDGLSAKDLALIQDLMEKGKKHIQAEDWPKAAKYLTQAWNLNPKDYNLLVLMAHVLGNLGVRRQALEVLEQALAIHGPQPDVLSVLGSLAIKLEMYEAMEKIYRIYVTLRPEDPIGYNNIASAMEKQDRLDECIEFLQHIIPVFPDCGTLWNTLGSAVVLRDGYKAAVPFYSEAYRLEPKSYNILSNISLAYEHSGDHVQAAKFAKKAIKLDPKVWHAHMGLATISLVTGDLRTGWREYEWRLDPNSVNCLHTTHDIPKWRGENLKGKRLLVCPEQGLGDEILFASTYPKLVEEAAQLYIGCDKRLITLMERSFPTAKISSYRDGFHQAFRFRHLPAFEGADAPPKADVSTFCGSIPRHRWSDKKSVHDVGDGFLIPDPDKLTFWKARLAELGPKPKIGIYWRSGKRDARRNKHYAPIELWEDLFKAFPDVDFINLQYGDTTEERAYVKDNFGTTVHSWADADLQNDLETVAALSKSVDLVIGPASAPGMFSFAVGTPTWWLLASRPWWSFGETERPLFFKKGRMLIGAFDDPWADIFPRLITDLRAFIEAR